MLNSSVKTSSVRRILQHKYQQEYRKRKKVQKELMATFLFLDSLAKYTGS